MINKRWIYFFKSYFWMPCYRPQFFAYTLSKYFVLFKFIAPSHKSDMSNSVRIMFIKISIVKVNIIKIYTKNTHFIT